MKNKILFSLLFAAGASAALSCNKLVEPSDHIDVGQPQLCDVSLTVDNGTRTMNTDSVKDKKINSFQVFVFDENGNIEYYIKSSTAEAKTVNMSLVPGTKTFGVIVNAKDTSNIPTFKDFRNTSFKLSDNTHNNFIMAGYEQKTINASNKTVSVSVSKLVSLITLDKVTISYSSDYISSKNTKIKNIYLVNVPADSKVDSVLAPQAWINKLKFETSSADTLVAERDINKLIEGNGSYEKTHLFYSCPNPTTDDSAASSWSPRYTRLVVETEYDGKSYYYPVTLPKIQSNKKYQITNLKITRLGSSSPDSPVSMLDCSCTISVTDWQSGTSKEEEI